MPPRSARMVRIGTAGWSIPRDHAHLCGGSGTHLERYSRAAVLRRDQQLVPSAARFGHIRQMGRGDATRVSVFGEDAAGDHARAELRRARVLLTRFLEETSGLGDKRGPVLIQLPPSLVFEPRVATRFFLALREQFPGWVVCEPRHPSWFTASADQLLQRHHVSRAAADPPRVEGGDLPGGWREAAYFRLHGSPAPTGRGTARPTWMRCGYPALVGAERRGLGDIRQHRIRRGVRKRVGAAGSTERSVPRFVVRCVHRL